MFGRALLIAAGSVALAAPARACSCSNGGPRVARERSAAVFLGRVVSVAPGRRLAYERTGVARLVATQAIKGVAARDTVAVEYVVGGGGDCGLELRRGMRLLVYALPPQAPGTLPLTDYCAGTQPLACAAADLRELAVAVPAGAGDCRVPRPSRPAARAEVEPADPPSNEALQLTSASKHQVSRLETPSRLGTTAPVDSGARS